MLHKTPYPIVRASEAVFVPAAFDELEGFGIHVCLFGPLADLSSAGDFFGGVDAHLRAGALERCGMIEDVEFFGQFCQLAELLPGSWLEAKWIRCGRCGMLLGCVGGRHGVAVGHFVLRDDESSRLVGQAVILEKKVPLKCTECGYVTRWRCAV